MTLVRGADGDFAGTWSPESHGYYMGWRARRYLDTQAIRAIIWTVSIPADEAYERLDIRSSL